MNLKIALEHSQGARGAPNSQQQKRFTKDLPIQDQIYN